MKIDHIDKAGLLWLITMIKTLVSTKVDKEEGKGISEANYTATEKTKLEGLKNYTHPTSSGNKHIPSGGAAGQFLKWSAD